MANQNKENDPGRKQGQQGGQPHQGGQPKNRPGETGIDRDRDTGDEDLGSKQSEGNLGNERTRSSEKVKNRKDTHDSSRLPE
jgi:hypothetical protein